MRRSPGFYALAERIAEGIPLLEHSLSDVETMGLGDVQPLFLVYLGEAYILAGRLADALEVAARALVCPRARSIPEHADGHYYRDAVALAEELGMGPLVAHCYVGLGKLYARTGKRTQADEHFAAAASMYREMDLSFCSFGCARADKGYSPVSGFYRGVTR
jgi:tetratricopeptide (TPR) repeat protein